MQTNKNESHKKSSLQAQSSHLFDLDTTTTFTSHNHYIYRSCLHLLKVSTRYVVSTSASCFDVSSLQFYQLL